MPVSPTYPGVYVQEVPSGVRTIVGVGTSIALFIGRTATGPMMRAVRLNTYSDFVRTFGDDGGIVSSTARYVRMFFLNGGTDCYVIRIADGALPAKVMLENENGANALELVAKNPGVLGDLLRASVNYNTASPEATFNLEVFRWELVGGVKKKAEREEFLNLTMDPQSPNYAPTVITQKSKLVNANDAAAAPTTDLGYSLGMAPIVHGANALGDAYGAIAATRSQFRISISGRPFITVDLTKSGNTPMPDAAATPPQVADHILAAIRQAVQDAQIVGLPNDPVEVRVLGGPAAPTPPHPAGSSTHMVRIRSVIPGTSVVIQSSFDPARDFASALMLGAANGGLEVGAYAARRPAPTGITMHVTRGLGNAVANDASITGNAFPLTWFSNLAYSSITNIVLDKPNAQGVLDDYTFPDPANAPPNNVLSPPFALASRPIWIDAANGPRGVLEALALLRDAVNTENAKDPSLFTWKAEVWGNRLTFVNTAGEDNATVVDVTPQARRFAGPTAAIITDLTTAFDSKNVRYYALGGSGTAGQQNGSTGGSDGSAPTQQTYTAAYEIARSSVDLFNLMVLPPDAAPVVPLEQLWPEASAFCASERAFLIMDPPPAWTDTQGATSGVNQLRIGLTKDHSAVYFPRLRIVESGLERTIGPAGAVAGLFARIDANRGVWKAPAGSEADLRGVVGVDLPMSDLQNGQINPAGVNAIRVFPEGVVSWGARTMDGADAFASEYKYVPIRRLALFLEESLYRGLKWAVFEPNDEPLWAQIRLNAGAFMHDLFRKGAFAGAKPSEAYFVKCDKETTTANDQNLGIVNIWVGFAPLKPAEFVILYLQQIAQKLAS